MGVDILDYNEKNGLVHSKHWDEAINNAERLYISEVSKLKVEAVLFRRFYNSDNSIIPYNSEPAVLIFREEDYSFNSKQHKILHSALWSSGRNEIYIILGKTRVDIMNARKPASVVGKELDLRSLRLANEALENFNDIRFSAYLFGNGTFWEQLDFEHKIDEKNSPYLYLLDYLMTVRKELLSNSEVLRLEAKTIDKLLIICILVKFLEEIKDDNGKHTLQEIYQKRNVCNFAEAIEKGYIIGVLNDLASEFNGKIFDRFSEPEKREIENTNLKLLALFLRADIDLKTKQLFLWEQYNFKHLPAEVISAIYENFIQADAERKNGKTEKGVVYTPIHLVNFMVDEVMPLEKSELFIDEKFRVIDPSCGSGVFLVAAYKRLLQWWAINNSSEGNIQYPQREVAQKILENNIFGVDVKKTATLVSILGLTTALLNKLTPKEIWSNLKFRDLTKNNIIHSNFFEWAVNFKKTGGRFDLAIGNPPFNIETGKKIEDVLNPETLDMLQFKHKKIPRNNFALHFFEGAMTIANTSCLIIPANILLHDKASQGYRHLLFTDFTIKNIFDFTHLRRVLFHKSADIPVVALVTINEPSSSQSINHTIVKREILSEKKIRFEIDHYDRNVIPFDWAVDETKQFIWKTNLLGGGRLFHLINRLALYENLKDFILRQKLENDEWTYSVGYKLNGSKRKPNIDYISGKDSIITETFDEEEAFSTFTEENTSFAEPRNPNIYKPPHIIYKVNLGRNNIPIHYSEKYLCFKDKLVGIHSPNNQKDILKRIYNQFKDCKYSKFSKFWILATSSESLVNQETSCKKEDIDSLPFSLSADAFSLSPFEQILQDDVLNYHIHLGKAIGRRGAGKVLHEKVQNTSLLEFGKYFCKTLNSIYEKEENSWQIGKVYQSNSFTICQFGFGKNGELKSGPYSIDDDEIKNLLVDEFSNKGVLYKRVVRFYRHINGFDCIYLIKPHALRYWLKSIALRDADETFMDLKKEGY